MPKRLARDERAKVARAAEIAAWHYHVFRPQLFQATRGEIEIATARQVAMYLAHCVGRVSMNKLARALRRDMATVSHDIQRVEDMREDPVEDARLTFLEAEFNAWLGEQTAKARAA